MNIIKKSLSYLSEMKKKALAFMLLIVATAAAHAEGETATNQVSDLWGSLNIDLAGFFEKVFEALSTPVGTVLAVIFVMCIFYLVVRLSSKAINPSKRVG